MIFSFIQSFSAICCFFNLLSTFHNILYSSVEGCSSHLGKPLKFTTAFTLTIRYECRNSVLLENCAHLPGIELQPIEFRSVSGPNSSCHCAAQNIIICWLFFYQFFFFCIILLSIFFESLMNIKYCGRGNGLE